MRYTSVASSILLALSLLAGCAAPYAQGLTALRQGRFEEAADHFQEVLAQDPNRLDALAGLGISRYKLGELDEAVDALDRVVAQSPTWPEARLYLGLSYLQRGQDGLAEEQLTVLLDQKPHPRTAAQIDRALRVMRLEPPSDELRGFLAASLDDEAAWEGEVRHARLALRDCAWQLRARPTRFLFLRPRRR